MINAVLNTTLGPCATTKRSCKRIVEEDQTQKQVTIPADCVLAIDAEQHLWDEFNKCYGTNVRP